MWIARTGIIAGSKPFSTLNTNLFAVFKAESNANDSLGVYNGTAVGGVTYVDGVSGNAFNLNSTNAYISLPNNSFNFASNFSFAASFKSNNTASQQMIFANFASGSAYGYGWYLYKINGYLVLELCNGATKSSYSIPVAWNTNTYKIVVTRLSSTETKVYINNTLMTSGTYTNGNAVINPSYVATQIHNIGSYGNGAGVFFDGIIDEIGVWNKVLTATEVTELQTNYYPF